MCFFMHFPPFRKMSSTYCNLSSCNLSNERFNYIFRLFNFLMNYFHNIRIEITLLLLKIYYIKARCRMMFPSKYTECLRKNIPLLNFNIISSLNDIKCFENSYYFFVKCKEDVRR